MKKKKKLMNKNGCPTMLGSFDPQKNDAKYGRQPKPKNKDSWSASHPFNGGNFTPK